MEFSQLVHSYLNVVFVDDESHQLGNHIWLLPEFIAFFRKDIKETERTTSIQTQLRTIPAQRE